MCWHGVLVSRRDDLFVELYVYLAFSSFFELDSERVGAYLFYERNLGRIL